MCMMTQQDKNQGLDAGKVAVQCLRLRCAGLSSNARAQARKQDKPDRESEHAEAEVSVCSVRNACSVQGTQGTGSDSHQCRTCLETKQETEQPQAMLDVQRSVTSQAVTWVKHFVRVRTSSGQRTGRGMPHRCFLCRAQSARHPGERPRPAGAAAGAAQALTTAGGLAAAMWQQSFCSACDRLRMQGAKRKAAVTEASASRSSSRRSANPDDRTAHPIAAMCHLPLLGSV